MTIDLEKREKVTFTLSKTSIDFLKPYIERRTASKLVDQLLAEFQRQEASKCKNQISPI